METAIEYVLQDIAWCAVLKAVRFDSSIWPLDCACGLQSCHTAAVQYGIIRGNWYTQCAAVAACRRGGAEHGHLQPRQRQPGVLRPPAHGAGAANGQRCAAAAGCVRPVPGIVLVCRPSAIEQWVDVPHWSVPHVSPIWTCQSHSLRYTSLSPAGNLKGGCS
jgi:hypothetical protein